MAHRPNCQGSSTNTGTLYPALVFKPLIDKIDLFKTKKLPVEFLSDNKLVFQEYSGLKTVTVSEERDNIPVSDSRSDCSNQSKSEFEMLLRQLFYAIKTQLRTPDYLASLIMPSNRLHIGQ